MGNNESLPPPPTPGEPPHVPLPPPGSPPPAQPLPPTQPVPPTSQFPTGQPMPPTQQVPLTQQYPAQQYPAQGIGPDGLPAGSAPAPKKKNTALLVGGGVVAVAALIGGVLLFTGGDDDEPGTVVVDTTAPAAVTTTAAPVTTVAPEETFVITTPVTTAPPVTSAPAQSTVPDSDLIDVTDDTGLFTVTMSSLFELDTTPQTVNGLTAAGVTGAENLDAYYSDNDTFGISVLAFNASEVTGDELLTWFSPGEGICGAPTTELGYPTSLGAVNMVRYDDCGEVGDSAKVIMVLPVPAQDRIVLVYGQGNEPSSGDLLDVTQFVLESLTAA